MFPNIRIDVYKVLCSGRIAGICAGPPCESWSIARAGILSVNERHDPRRLRSRQHPWGDIDLRPKELDQGYAANVLLACALELVSIATLASLPACIEHPSDTWWPKTTDSAASILMLEEIQAVMPIKGVKRAEVNQGTLEQISLKPTPFLVSQMNSFEGLGKQFSIYNPELSAISHGRNEQGGCNSAPEKEYPALLSAKLGGANVQDLVLVTLIITAIHMILMTFTFLSVNGTINVLPTSWSCRLLGSR